jgi:hypothetical protein
MACRPGTYQVRRETEAKMLNWEHPMTKYMIIIMNTVPPLEPVAS